MNRVFIALIAILLGLFVVFDVLAQGEASDETATTAEETSEEAVSEDAEEDAESDEDAEEDAESDEDAEEDVESDEDAEEDAESDEDVEEVLAYPEGYRNWTHIKSMIIQPNHELAGLVEGFHHIYANEIALKGYLSEEGEESEGEDEEAEGDEAEGDEAEDAEAEGDEAEDAEAKSDEAEGTDSVGFEDGSVIVLDLLETSFIKGAIVEGANKAVIVMERDSERFPDTGGWGFQIFAADEDHTPIETDGAACFACHTAVEDNDFVFSTYRP